MALPPYFPSGFSQAPLVLTQLFPCRRATASQRLSRPCWSVTQGLEAAWANRAVGASCDHTEDPCPRLLLGMAL